MKDKRNVIKCVIFNVAETMLIILMGLLMKVPINSIVIIILTFVITRGCLGKALHFKAWYRCLIWSSLILLSLFMIFKINLTISLLFAIFSAFIMTGKSDIKDMYLWNNSNEPSKYQDIIEFIKYNELDDKLIEFETKLKARNMVEYLIYKYRFKEGKTFSEISELLDVDSPRVAEYLNKIAFAIRLYCGI